jgi:hypothetical protein
VNNFSRNITLYIAYIILLHAIIPHYHSAQLAIDGKVSNSYCLLEDLQLRKDTSSVTQNQCSHQGIHLNHELETGNFHNQKNLITENQFSLLSAIIDNVEAFPIPNQFVNHQHLGFKISQFALQDGFNFNDSLRGPPSLI